MQLQVHAGVDRLAMWIEDRVRRDPQPFIACVERPLDCFAPLGLIPDAPAREGTWHAPSPRPLRHGDGMMMHVTACRAPFRGTIVVAPPWKTRTPALLRPYTDLLADAGHDVWLVVPPEHMGRARPGERSGEAFATLDVGRFRAMFEQLVLELRTAIAMAARRGPAGLVGLSAGALAAAFAATAQEKPRLAALLAPPADLASVLSATPIGRRYSRLAARAGSRWPSLHELRRSLACFDPGRRPRPSCPVFIAAGRYDRIALADGALTLADAWDVAPRMYARGHLTLLFACRPLLRDLAEFVARHP